MESRSEFPCSQEPVTCLCREPMNPVHSLTPYSPKIHSNNVHHLRLYLPSGHFSSSFPTKILYAFLICYSSTTL